MSRVGCRHASYLAPAGNEFMRHGCDHASQCNTGKKYAKPCPIAKACGMPQPRCCQDTVRLPPGLENDLNGAVIKQDLSFAGKCIDFPVSDQAPEKAGYGNRHESGDRT